MAWWWPAIRSLQLTRIPDVNTTVMQPLSRFFYHSPGKKKVRTFSHEICSFELCAVDGLDDEKRRTRQRAGEKNYSNDDGDWRVRLGGEQHGKTCTLPPSDDKLTVWRRRWPYDGAHARNTTTATTQPGALSERLNGCVMADGRWAIADSDSSADCRTLCWRFDFTVSVCHRATRYNAL